ncbi:MAG TPA: ferrochelatase [Bryobacteraceae bacterium]|jgi:ferrochelatase
MSFSNDAPYQALLVMSFGGPERPEDVMPFLENVTRGRNTPRERLLEVAEHYYHFGGKSPINDQCRALIAALQAELDRFGPPLPVYWGNRNWHPFLKEALQQMKADGIQRALAFVTSAYSSYSGCRQYRENIEQAREVVGEGAPQVDKLRVFYNHPHFIEPSADRIREALSRFPAGQRIYVIFTAHSLPLSLAKTSDYQKQLEETARLVAEQSGVEHWKLVFQSRSGSPSQPWLEPDILDYLRKIRTLGIRQVVVAPIGFISDHMEVAYDLDIEAKDLAIELGMTLVRAATVGTHPVFIRMIRELMEERLDPAKPKLAIGRYGPYHDVCAADCCPVPVRPHVPR